MGFEQFVGHGIGCWAAVPQRKNQAGCKAVVGIVKCWAEIDDRNLPIFGPAFNFAAKEIIDIGLRPGAKGLAALLLHHGGQQYRLMDQGDLMRVAKAFKQC